MSRKLFRYLLVATVIALMITSAACGGGGEPIGDSPTIESVPEATSALPEPTTTALSATVAAARSIGAGSADTIGDVARYWLRSIRRPDF